MTLATLTPIITFFVGAGMGAIVLWQLLKRNDKLKGKILDIDFEKLKEL